MLDIEKEKDHGLMQPQAKECQGRKELEEARDRFVLTASGGSTARGQCVWPSDTDFGLLIPQEN